jgi:medium-chain acyl-[acyl-carrier-protein] hydrolase
LTSEENKKYTTKRFRVRSYEIDRNGNATISSICNYFQEAAGLHANQLNFDIGDLMKQGLTWILYRLHVKILRFPKRWDEIKVTTWPSAGNGIRAFRDYELWNSNGECAALGLSQWMVFDTEKKRPVKIPRQIIRFGENSFDHVLPEDRRPIPEIHSDRSAFITTAGMHDLDMNNHVNNVKYIDWITGFLPDTFAGNHRCAELQIQYAAEAKKGNKIYLSRDRSKENEHIFHHTLYNQNYTMLAKSTARWEQV